MEYGLRKIICQPLDQYDNPKGAHLAGESVEGPYPNWKSFLPSKEDIVTPGGKYYGLTFGIMANALGSISKVATALDGKNVMATFYYPGRPDSVMEIGIGRSEYKDWPAPKARMLIMPMRVGQ